MNKAGIKNKERKKKQDKMKNKEKKTEKHIRRDEYVSQRRIKL